MSGLMRDTTYNQLINNVADWLNTNCGNVGTMKLPSCFQAGWAKNFNGDKGGYTVKISNYISLVSRDTVVSELQRFYRDRGITNLDMTIGDNNFLACFNNLVSFISTKVCLVVSPYNTSSTSASIRLNNPSKYIAYFSNKTSYKQVQALENSSTNEKIILPDDMFKMFNILLNVISNSRTVQIKYTISLF